MEWLRCIKSTIDYIEKNIKSIKSIDEVANSQYISTFYLQTGFQIVTGYSIGEYIRNRKLYLSAIEIENGRKITNVAFEFGYETVESFTKAFKRFHGFLPSKIKENAIRTFSPLTINIQIKGGDKMDLKYKITKMFPIKLIGFVKEFSFENSYQKIPMFWDEIYSKYFYPRIYKGLPAQNEYEKAIVDNSIGEYGVCIDCQGDKFKYLIAGKYTGGNVPKGMMIFEFPCLEWAIFDCIGPCPEKLQELNTKIFKEWLPLNNEYELSGNGNIEWYDYTNRNMNDADYHTQIWIPVKKIKAQ